MIKFKIIWGNKKGGFVHLPINHQKRPTNDLDRHLDHLAMDRRISISDKSTITERYGNRK